MLLNVLRKMGVAAAALAFAGYAAAGNSGDSWTGPDKILHFGAGFLISDIVTVQTRNPWYGFAAGTGAGILKEVADRGSTGFSGKDLAVTMVGAAVGSAFGGWLITRNNGTTMVSYSTQFK